MPQRAAAPLFSIRSALALLLVLGAMALSAAPALAVSGSSRDGNVASAQYPDNETGERLGGGAAGGGAAGGGAGGGGDSDGGSLPYTGFVVAALAGIGLLAVTGGSALRRRTAE